MRRDLHLTSEAALAPQRCGESCSWPPLRCGGSCTGRALRRELQRLSGGSCLRAGQRRGGSSCAGSRRGESCSAVVSTWARGRRREDPAELLCGGVGEKGAEIGKRWECGKGSRR